jgi:hypothetical protein
MKLESLKNGKFKELPATMLKNTFGGAVMSKCYQNGSPSTGNQTGYDSAEKTGSGGDTTWDGVRWFDMCGNASTLDRLQHG